MSEGLSSSSSIRVLLCGEAGVGKSSLAELICEEQPSSLYHPTCGCRVHITSCGEGSYDSPEIFVEIFDVGGNRRYASSRGVFYEHIDGIIFVYVAYCSSEMM